VRFDEEGFVCHSLFSGFSSCRTWFGMHDRLDPGSSPGWRCSLIKYVLTL